jgi:hypothetical protein
MGNAGALIENKTFPRVNYVIVGIELDEYACKIHNNNKMCELLSVFSDRFQGNRYLLIDRQEESRQLRSLRHPRASPGLQTPSH